MLKSNRGITLIELMIYTGLTALVVSLFSTVFLWIGSDFRMKIAENKAEMNLLEASFTLRRVLAQARHLEAADDSTGDLTNLFFTPQADTSGKIAIGPLDGSNFFDTFAIPNAPANYGKFYSVARFEREESHGDFTLDPNTRFYSTAIFYRAPNPTALLPKDRSGAIVVMLGGNGVGTNLQPSDSGWVFEDMSRFRIKNFEVFPGTKRVSSVTFELTTRYFTNNFGNQDYWWIPPPGPYPAGDAPFRDISRDVTVVVRDNLLDNTGGLIKAAGQVRPYNGLYFFRPSIRFDH